MKILNFGSANIDLVYSVEHFVSAGETLSADKLCRFAGGKGLNQSIAVARSGEKVYHAGCIGTDGEFLKELLSESGVDVCYLKTVDAPSGHAVIQVDPKGENCILLHTGANFMITTEYVDEVLTDFSAGDILILQNEISCIQYIIKSASDKGLKIIFNPSPFNESLKNLDLSLIDTLILNEVEAAQFSNKENPTEILDYFKENYGKLNIMLTLGKRGCVYMNSKNGERTFCPAFSVDAVDTTAAGDTFTGYFVCGIARGLSIDKILKTASAASALAVSKAGAAPSIPSKTEVEKALPLLNPLLKL